MNQTDAVLVLCNLLIRHFSCFEKQQQFTRHDGSGDL